MPIQAQNTIRDGPVRLILVNKETGRDRILSLNKSCCDGGRPLWLTTQTVVEINKKVITHTPTAFNQRGNNLVKQKHALLRPKGKTAKVKYLSTPLKGQAKPRYFWRSGEILSTWWYPDLRFQVKNQCPSCRNCDSERRSSYLNLNERGDD